MRQIVDEKLQTTPQQRLGESFNLISERLEQAHRGIGEMQTLATGVGDLKRVLSNVKTMGTWVEKLLEALLDQILSPENGKDVEVVPGSGEYVEFGVKLPGHDPTTPVWIPIDSKFPKESYERLVIAYEAGDFPGVEQAGATTRFQQP